MINTNTNINIKHNNWSEAGEPGLLITKINTVPLMWKCRRSETTSFIILSERDCNFSFVCLCVYTCQLVVLFLLVLFAIFEVYSNHHSNTNMDLSIVSHQTKVLFQSVGLQNNKQGENKYTDIIYYMTAISWTEQKTKRRNARGLGPKRKKQRNEKKSLTSRLTIIKSYHCGTNGRGRNSSTYCVLKGDEKTKNNL